MHNLLNLIGVCTLVYIHPFWRMLVIPYIKNKNKRNLKY